MNMRGPLGTILLYLAVYGLSAALVVVIVVSIWKTIELLIEFVRL